VSELADLAARIERLERQEAARALSVRYAKALDESDLEALADAFAEDAVLDAAGRIFTGRAAVVGFYRAGFTTHPRLERRHFITNHEHDGARMRSYFVFTFRGDDVFRVGWGRYDDEITVAGGVARFARKAITIDFQTDR
jgi:hypothetical protein